MQDTDTGQAAVERNAWDHVALLATIAWLISAVVGVYLTFTTDNPLRFLTHATNLLFIGVWLVARAQNRKRQRA